MLFVVLDPNLRDELTDFAEEVGINWVTFVTKAPKDENGKQVKTVVLGNFGNFLQFQGVPRPCGRHDVQVQTINKRVRNLKAIMEQNGYPVRLPR